MKFQKKQVYCSIEESIKKLNNISKNHFVGLELEDVLTVRREEIGTFIRHLFMEFLAKEGHTQEAIAEQLNRERSTISVAISNIKLIRDSDYLDRKKKMLTRWDEAVSIWCIENE